MLVNELLIGMQIHRQNAILLNLITPQVDDFSHWVLFESSHRYRLHYRFFLNQALDSAFFGHQTRYFILSECTENRLRVEFQRTQLFSKSLSFFAVSSYQYHFRLVLFYVELQVLAPHKIFELRLFGDGCLESVEWLS